MITGFVFHEKYLWHDTGSQWLIPPNVPPIQPLGHPEGPESKRRLSSSCREQFYLCFCRQEPAPLG